MPNTTPKAMDTKAEWLRPATCAALLNIGISTYWQFVADGALPKPNKVGARIAVTRRTDLLDAFEKLVARGEQHRSSRATHAAA